MAKNYKKLYEKLLVDHESVGIELLSVREDRDAYRDWFIVKFGWFVECSADNKIPILPSLILSMWKFRLTRLP